MTRPSNFGTAIKIEREKRGWSQRELERKAGLRGGYISKLESGSLQWPGTDQGRLIAAVFDMTPDELLEGVKIEIPRRTALVSAAETIGWSVVRAIQSLSDEQRHALLELTGQTAPERKEERRSKTVAACTDMKGEKSHHRESKPRFGTPELLQEMMAELSRMWDELPIEEQEYIWKMIEERKRLRQREIAIEE